MVFTIGKRVINKLVLIICEIGIIIINPILQIMMLSHKDRVTCQRSHGFIISQMHFIYFFDNHTWTKIGSGDHSLVLCRQLIYESAFHGPTHLLSSP